MAANKEKKETVKDYKPFVYISWLKEMIELVDKNGYFKLIKVSLMLVFIGWVLYIGNNPEIIINKYITYKTKQHNEAVQQRLDIDPKIRLILKDILLQLCSDRTFLIELHNGSNNLGGLPFTNGDMSYEEVAHGVIKIDEDYQNIRLSRFPFLTTLFKNGAWIGTIDELKPYDTGLAYRLKSNNVNKIALLVIEGVDTPIAIIGLTYCNDNMPQNITDAQIISELRKYSNKIIALLSSDLMQIDQK